MAVLVSSMPTATLSTITPIIENTIRKVLDEKLTQILTAKETSSLNENLVVLNIEPTKSPCGRIPAF